jgi:hypothetical protein
VLPSTTTYATRGPVVTAQTAGITIASGGTMIGYTVPGSPYQIGFAQAHLSRYLAVADQRIELYDHTNGQFLTRITAGTPSTGQYLLDSSTGVATFAAVDTGNRVDFADLTYGAELRRYTGEGVVDEGYSFVVGEVPIRAVRLAWLPLTLGYQVSVEKAWGAGGETIEIAQAINAPSSLDGSRGSTVARLLGSGLSGGVVTIKVRHTLPASGEGVLLSVQGTDYDLPF